MKKITILIFMTLCLLLTGCQGNVNKTEQKEEKAKTPNKDDHKTCRTYKAAMILKTPKIRNIHQQRVPK